MALSRALCVFLCLLADHSRVPINPMIYALKRMEVEFCVRLLMRDFVVFEDREELLTRLLQYFGSCVPEFITIWRDLLLNLKQFRPDGFEDILQVHRLGNPI